MSKVVFKIVHKNSLKIPEIPENWPKLLLKENLRKSNVQLNTTLTTTNKRDAWREIDAMQPQEEP